jgi:hypothetical protein
MPLPFHLFYRRFTPYESGIPPIAYSVSHSRMMATPFDAQIARDLALAFAGLPPRRLPLPRHHSGQNENFESTGMQCTSSRLIHSATIRKTPPKLK